MMVCVVPFAVLMGRFVLGAVMIAVRFFGMVRFMIGTVNVLRAAAMASAPVAVCHGRYGKAARQGKSSHRHDGGFFQFS